MAFCIYIIATEIDKFTSRNLFANLAFAVEIWKISTFDCRYKLGLGKYRSGVSRVVYGIAKRGNSACIAYTDGAFAFDSLGVSGDILLIILYKQKIQLERY